MNLVDYFNTGENDQTGAAGNTWRAMTFTASKNYTPEQIKLKLSRAGLPGDCIISLRATSGGLPTGADLGGITCTIDGNGFPLGAGAWQTFLQTFSALTLGVKYAIVLRAPNASGGAEVQWWVKIEGGYGGGNVCRSSDGGSAWTSRTEDAMFETYEEEAPPAAEGAMFQVL